MKQLLAILVLAVCASAQSFTFSTLYSFKGSDPAFPSFLTLDSRGNLYGCSDQGGALGKGAIFELSPAGKLTVLYTFTGGSDRKSPNSLARNTRTGTLYGTTGTTIFKLTLLRSGKYQFQTLYSNSQSLLSSAMLDSSGNLYGIDNDCTTDTNPCVWEIPIHGIWTDIFALGAQDPGNPYSMTGNLVNRAGILYVPAGFDGSAFEYWVQEVGGSDSTFGPAGVIPNSLRQDAQGDIYSLAYGDFVDSGTYGTIFKESPQGVMSILYTFVSDEGQPSGLFSLDTKGNLFGTYLPGFVDTVNVFELQPGGVPIILHSDPTLDLGLIMDSQGNLYGTTSVGANGLGSVWKLTKGK